MRYALNVIENYKPLGIVSSIRLGDKLGFPKTMLPISKEAALSLLKEHKSVFGVSHGKAYPCYSEDGINKWKGNYGINYEDWHEYWQETVKWMSKSEQSELMYQSFLNDEEVNYCVLVTDGSIIYNDYRRYLDLTFFAKETSYLKIQKEITPENLVEAFVHSVDYRQEGYPLFGAYIVLIKIDGVIYTFLIHKDNIYRISDEIKIARMPGYSPFAPFLQPCDYTS